MATRSLYRKGDRVKCLATKFDKDAAKEAAYLKNLFYELKIDCPRAVPLKCDNQSTIKQSINQVDQRRCRHLGMRTHYLRQQCHSVGNLELEFGRGMQ